MTNELLQSVVCNLCGADDAKVIYPSQRHGEAKVGTDEFRSSGDEPLIDPLVHCCRCGLKYVTPRLNPTTVLEGYAAAVDETFVSQAKARERTFTRCLDIMQALLGQRPGRLLDIGTANGSFLKVARDAGWDVAGCEPNRWMVEWCRRNYGIPVTAGTIFDGHYASESFDVITLWDVLEHTPDPMAVLRECHRLLKDGGLVVVNYPDIDSWIARVMGRKWVFLLSVHYYYFTPKTVRRALEQAALRPLKFKAHFQSLEFDYILQRATPYAPFLAQPLRRLVNALGLGKMDVPYWMGQTLVIARKQAHSS
jgi:2-polyprenyl-3-methyl-5-hydroxy-6-metoxy-1,4-benzoquinol methylase